MHQCFLGSLFLLGRAKGHTKIVWIPGISICLFVCYTPCFFSLPEDARRKLDFMIIMGWFWIWVVGIAIWEKMVCWRKFFSSPKLQQNSRICMFVWKGFVLCICCAPTGRQEKLIFWTRWSSSLGGASCLLDWVESNLFGLGVCFWASGQACLLWVTSFVWFLWTKTFVLRLQTVCVCVRACKLRARWGGSLLSGVGILLSQRTPCQRPKKSSLKVWSNDLDVFFNLQKSMPDRALRILSVLYAFPKLMCVSCFRPESSEKLRIFWEGFCRIFFWEFAVLRKKVWEREVCS